MQERHLRCPPTFSFGPAVPPQFFHCRIATGCMRHVILLWRLKRFLGNILILSYRSSVLIPERDISRKSAVEKQNSTKLDESDEILVVNESFDKIFSSAIEFQQENEGEVCEVRKFHAFLYCNKSKIYNWRLTSYGLKPKHQHKKAKCSAYIYPIHYTRGRQPTARGSDPAFQAKSSGPQPLYQIVVTVYGQPSGIIFYESALLPHCAINVFYEAFWAFVTNCENQELIWLKFQNSQDLTTAKGTELLVEN